MLSGKTKHRLQRKLERLRARLDGTVGTQVETERTRIDTALARMADGRYGECRSCKLDIESGRLEADPATPFCDACFEELATRRRPSYASK